MNWPVNSHLADRFWNLPATLADMLYSVSRTLVVTSKTYKTIWWSIQKENLRPLCKWRYRYNLRMVSIFDTKVNNVLRIVFFKLSHSITRLSPTFCIALWDYPKRIRRRQKHLPNPPFIGRDCSCLSMDKGYWFSVHDWQVKVLPIHNYSWFIAKKNQLYFRCSFLFVCVF